MNTFIIIAATLGLIALITFIVKMVRRMAKQLEPDSHLKTVDNVLIEGESINVVFDTNMERVET